MGWLRRASFVAAVAVLAIILLNWHWLIVHLSQETGMSNEASRSYAFWSGFAGELRDLVEVPIVVALFCIHRNCHHHRCWRVKTFPGEGGWRWCRDHHPDLKGEHPTTEKVAEIHRARKGT